MGVRKFVFIALLFICTGAFSREYSATLSCMAESPVDGSLWIGTAGDGVFRMGRNGRRVRYNVQSGHFDCDSIITLGFDNRNVLWILDRNGNIVHYTSVEGFKKQLSIPETISAAAFSRDSSVLYFSTAESHLYVLNLENCTYSLCPDVTVKLNEIYPSVEFSSMWGIADDGIVKYSPNKGLITWEDGPDSSNLLPFEFDTTTPTDGVKTYKRTAVVLLIISIALAVAALFLLYLLLFKRPEIRSVTLLPDTPVVEKNETVVIPEIISSVTLGSNNTTLPSPDTPPLRARVPNINDNHSASGFTKVVTDLISKNLSDPDFDVDSIAAITGMSRIHVNRKLKAEGSPSPSVLLKDARMSLAAKLLKEGKLSVKEVGEKCGFSRPSYFATSFKEYFGISPSSF